MLPVSKYVQQPLCLASRLVPRETATWVKLCGTAPIIVNQDRSLVTKRYIRPWTKADIGSFGDDWPRRNQLSNPAPPELKFGIRRKGPKLTIRSEEQHDGVMYGPDYTHRLNKLRKIATALVRYERLEGMHQYCIEVRGYVERLIQEAMLHGDTHKKTMEVLSYWMMDKDLVQKIFKVLVPRYEKFTSAFTAIYTLPMATTHRHMMAVLELKGNPYPPVIPHQKDHSRTLTNVLLSAMHADIARREREGKLGTAVYADQDATVDDMSGRKDNKDNIHRMVDDVTSRLRDAYHETTHVTGQPVRTRPKTDHDHLVSTLRDPFQPEVKDNW